MMTIMLMIIIIITSYTINIIIIIIIMMMEGKEAFGVWIKVAANRNFYHVLMPLNVKSIHYMFHAAR